MKEVEAETGEAGPETEEGGEAEAGAEALMEVAEVATVTGAREAAMIGAMTETMAVALLEVAEAEEAGGTLPLILPGETEATTADIITVEDTETTMGPRILVTTAREVLGAGQ